LPQLLRHASSDTRTHGASHGVSDRVTYGISNRLTYGNPDRVTYGIPDRVTYGLHHRVTYRLPHRVSIPFRKIFEQPNTTADGSADEDTDCWSGTNHHDGPNSEPDTDTLRVFVLAVWWG
jgi:hypothetical protein